MSKGSLIRNMLLAAVFLFGVPAAIFYLYDTARVAQLNELNSKIAWADKQKEINIISEQMKEKLNIVYSATVMLSEQKIQEKYSGVISDYVIRNSSYSDPKVKSKIRSAYQKRVSGLPGVTALLYPNGNIVAGEEKSSGGKYAQNAKFIQAKASKKTISDIRFSEGIAEYFIPIVDVKDNLASILFVKENIEPIADKIRKETQSVRGRNFIINMAGTVLLSTDKSKENAENIQESKDLKLILTDNVEDENIKEAVYVNERGLLAYKKNRETGMISCVFTPYMDYKSLQTDSVKKYSHSIFDTKYILPVYAILGLGLLAGLLIIIGASGAPFAPVSKITKAMTHIDEESFESMLPKLKNGPYKKMSDSLVILKGRINASEDKAAKLSQMSKELEEELSKEASRADMEISELRDALKIAENGKVNFEDEASKLKAETARVKKELEDRLKTAADEAKSKIEALEREKIQLKEEAKKIKDAPVVSDKEDMRTDAVLMMNTELKGVLSVIKTYISSVLGGEGKITDAQQQFLGVVINKSARLERLINDLSELARLEKGEIKLNQNPVDVNTIIQDIIFSVQPQADVKKVDIKTKFMQTLNSASGDSARLSAVLSQLLTQSIKVSPRGGAVSVETKQEGSLVKIVIMDYGMSMPKSKAESLFSNFHGPESQAGPEFINSGLRFPIIKAVIKKMGGDIWIESEIGKGKAFIISLPFDKKGGLKPDAVPAFKSEPAKTAAEIKTVMPEIKIQTAEKMAPLPELESLPDIKSAEEPQKPKIVNSFASMFGGQEQPKDKPAEKSQASFKIQTNSMAGWDTSKKPETQPEVIKINDILDMEKPAGPVPELPGKDITIPEKLLEKEPSAPFTGELPPLPDLEDDKGTDII